MATKKRDTVASLRMELATTLQAWRASQHDLVEMSGRWREADERCKRLLQQCDATALFARVTFDRLSPERRQAVIRECARFVTPELPF